MPTELQGNDSENKRRLPSSYTCSKKGGVHGENMVDIEVCFQSIRGCVSLVSPGRRKTMKVQLACSLTSDQ